MHLIRTLTSAPMISLFSLVFLAGCPEEPPSAPVAPKIAEPAPAKEPAPKVVKEPDVVVIADAPAPPEDPPGTLYTWEDASQNISITQTPPPEGATLIRKEMPRVVQSDSPAFGNGTPKTTAAPKRKTGPTPDAQSAAMAANIISMINEVRSDTVAASKYYARFTAKGAPKAVKDLGVSRRKLKQLKSQSELNRHAAGGASAVKKALFAKGLHVQITGHLRDRAGFDGYFINNVGFRNAVLNPSFAYVGGQCPKGGYNNCIIAFAQSVSKR